jgi:TetR/AcrR family transcriptional regulator, transcriptional repressor for nem operon
MGRTSDAKEKLLNVAFELIWDNSYGSVSVDHICDRAKVNKGSFYYFFQSKSDLAVAAYDEQWKSKQAMMDRVFSAQVPALERLSNWCRYIYQSQKEKAEQYGHVCGCPYASIGIELATQDDKIRCKASELMARTAKYYESAIAEAKRDGLALIKDPKAAAEQVYAFVLGTIMQAKIQNDIEVLRNLEPTVMTIIGARVEVPA